MKKIRITDVWDTRAKFKAVAECQGVGSEPCMWTPWWPQDDRDVRNQAKKHIQDRPFHRVIVTVKDITEYYVPKRVLETEG